MRVRDVMTKYPSCCTPECSLETVARMMRDRDCGAIPIVGDLASQFPLAIITDRDIVLRAVAEGRDIRAMTVRDCMTTPVITVPEDLSLGECIELLEERQIRRVVVVDYEGRCCGVVAQADIATHASKRKAGELLQQVSQPMPADATLPHR